MHFLQNKKVFHIKKFIQEIREIVCRITLMFNFFIVCNYTLAEMLSYPIETLILGLRVTVKLKDACLYS